jgi:hypothetical protein
MQDPAWHCLPSSLVRSATTQSVSESVRPGCYSLKEVLFTKSTLREDYHLVSGGQQEDDRVKAQLGILTKWLGLTNGALTALAIYSLTHGQSVRHPRCVPCRGW